MPASSTATPPTVHLRRPVAICPSCVTVRPGAGADDRCACGEPLLLRIPRPLAARTR